MPLCASGEISLAGSTVGRSVACELSLSGTAAICMDQAAVRTLAGRAGSGTTISLSDFYGKSSVPPVGCPFCGGYYMGAVSAPSNYYLIAAPNSVGCGGYQWKTTRTVSPCTCSTNDGYANTYNGLNNASHPAGQFTATRSINGYSDWYLQSTGETTGVIVGILGSLPAGEGWVGTCYWTSNESTSFPAARAFVMSDGSVNDLQAKNATHCTRAIRRQPF